MYLSKLEIQGFKSFAKKTVFEFPEFSNHHKHSKSVSAVVGPNGSGKSNVSDAIRWVLGEQSLKLIRCKKSDDVIFGGSHSKARQGMAEVSIHFDNHDKVLPIEFSEVVLTRRVYRDGETEYLINKKKVRLFDILMLLAKANFGQKSYSIVGQGMVDHIINISAYERKEFFDEATGVKQYQIKRDQAVNRLKRSRENLLQTNQILQELEPRLRLLTRQIKKLEKRKEVETELRAKQKNYYGYINNNLQNDKKRHSDQSDVKEGIKQELSDELEKIQSELAQLAREESRKDIFNELQKKHNKISNEKNELLKDLTVVKGKMSLEYSKAGKQNLSWLEDKKEELGKRINEIKESYNNLKVKISSKETDLESFEKKTTEIDSELVVLQNNLRTAEDELSRLKSGGKMSETMYSVKALLRQKGVINGIFGTVGDLAKVDEMYETAMATAAGARVLGIVVATDDVAIKCIKFLKDQRLAPLTFYPLSKLRSWRINADQKHILEENGAIGFAQELIKYDDKFEKVYAQIFGSTVIVDTLENAKQIGIGRERLITLEGDTIEKAGIMKGGYSRRSQRWQRLGDDQVGVSQEEKVKEIAILKQKIADRSQQRESFVTDVNSLRVDGQINDSKFKGLTNELASLEKEKAKIEEEIADNQVDPDKQTEFHKNLDKKKTELERKFELIEEQSLTVRKELDEFNLEEEKKKATVFRLQKEMQEYQMKLNEVNNEVNDINIAIAKLETKQEDLDREIRQELGAEFDISKVTVEEIINQEQEVFSINKLKHNLEMIGGIDPEIVDEHKEVSERYEFLSKQVIDLEKGINDSEKIVGELDIVIQKQFKATFKKINESFGKYFEKIFEGGKAKLSLIQKESQSNVETQNLASTLSTENPDPTEGGSESEEEENKVEKQLVENKSKLANTGIEIMVAPPNKKISNIAILSGGERTMTSLALICAIIDSNPAPFIVMDEVDAALDEANSEKFGNILQELSSKSQFVVITHNRVIMHVSDVLHGVAMGDDGVSKTLSLSLKEAEATVEK
ncbi:AAA family ATPase [Candidatus Falkowbacteria bacterium]|jgi:chromosome segregation protein|nr:AAA family ATPase [Candidatus Falkowbacteria bacterium]MBT7007016.1 AAA family ATPase [Candidatus Falkowbacteria bacterium]